MKIMFKSWNLRAVRTWFLIALCYGAKRGGPE